MKTKIDNIPLSDIPVLFNHNGSEDITTSARYCLSNSQKLRVLCVFFVPFAVKTICFQPHNFEAQKTPQKLV